MPSLATNSEVSLAVTVKNTAGSLVDPTTIELHWRAGRYGSENVVPQASLSHPSTGVYTASIIPPDPMDGNNWVDNIKWWWSGIKGAPTLLYYEFRMTNPTYVERGKVALSTSEFCS